MKRVISFNIAQRKRDALLAFFKAVITASQSDEKVTALCSIQLEALDEAYNIMQRLAERHQMSLLTPEVQEADGWRDANLTRFRASVRAECKNPDMRKRSAAELLWKICQETGRVHNQPFDQQTGALTTLCLDLENNHPAELELLGLTDAFDALKASNEAFIRILAERTEEEGSHEKGASYKARVVAISAYRDYVMKLNTLVCEGHYPELASFIDYLNAEIERQRIALGQGAGNEGSDSGDSDEVVIPQKTATFKLADGRIEKVKAEVGTVLLAPQSTPGYHWKPEVPEVMPAKNTTYTEVENKRVKLTFHFLDHSEEDVEGLAGAALTAPQNTEGCVWKPAVPEVMPDEDTQYFETLVSEGDSEGSDGSEDSDGSEEKPDTPPVGEEKPKYTVNWINKAGETVKTMEVEAGTKLTSSDYPKASSGYVWKPSWIGGGLTINGDTTIREELDDDLGV